PPDSEWNLTPYRLLLPVQLGILGLMAWIDLDMSRGAGFWANPKPNFGQAVLWFAYAYAAVMLVRYLVRMWRRPEQRWFGGAIPIVFHWVLASYLWVLGSFHASYLEHMRAGEPAKFVLVGTAGYFVNLRVFTGLYGAGMSYLPASIVSYFVANTAMYLGNRYFTFRLGHAGFWATYLRYLLTGAVVGGLAVGVLA